MNLKDNIRINRTKMLDEAAMEHRPSHFIHTFLIFLLVYCIATLVINLITTIPMAVYLLTGGGFGEILEWFASDSASSAELENIMAKINEDMPWYVTLVSLLAEGALIGAAVIYCKFIEKRKKTLNTLGFRKSNIALEYGLGLVIGLVMYALTFLIAYLCGSVSFVEGASFSFNIVLFLIAFIVQGAAEEVFFRGYLMVSVARDYKVVLAVLFSSAVFSLMHASNSGVSMLALVNIFLFGVFEAIYILKRGDIWGACAIHTMWNFAQGNIFGSSVSGNAIMPSIFTTVYNSDMSAANGGSFGLEGGFAATIVLLVAIGALMLVKPKQSELPDYELNREQYTNENNF